MRSFSYKINIKFYYGIECEIKTIYFELAKSTLALLSNRQKVKTNCK